MKIILATPVYPPEQSSPAKYIKELALKLRDHHELTIVAYASTSERIDGTTLFTISKRRPLPLRLIKYFITLYNAGEDADVIYVQNAMASGFPAVLVGRLRKIPVVLRFVGDEAWEQAVRSDRTKKKFEEFLEKPEGGLSTRFRMMMQRYALRRADIVTTQSLYIRDLIVKKYGIKSERAVVNYDAAIFDPVSPFPATPASHQIVTIAESNKEKSGEKGLNGIIRAVAILAKKYSDVRVVIVGAGSEDAGLKSLAVEMGVADRINFTGNISRAETLHIRKSSAVYVLNSTYEKVPHAVLTAFTANIPIVATNIPTTSEVVEDNISGLLVPVENGETNPVALAEAIGKIFDDASLRVKLVRGAEQILKEKFSWESHLKNLLGLFESLGSAHTSSTKSLSSKPRN